MKNVLVVNNYDSFVHNVVQLLHQSGLCTVDVVHNDCICFGSLNRYDGILLSPGPGVPTTSGQLMELIAHCKTIVPMLGICLGHQALAELFGAKLRNIERPLHGHSSQLVFTAEDDIIYRGIEQPIIVGRYHSWVVDTATMPDELIVSSVDEDGNIMSFYHKTLPVHGVQFHPESYISNCGAVIINNWLQSL